MIRPSFRNKAAGNTQDWLMVYGKGRPSVGTVVDCQYLTMVVRTPVEVALLARPVLVSCYLQSHLECSCEELGSQRESKRI